jgi:hypothetical protein
MLLCAEKTNVFEGQQAETIAKYWTSQTCQVSKNLTGLFAADYQ